MAATAEKLSHQPLDPVPHYGIAHFATNRDPQSGFSAIIIFADNDEIGGVDLLAGSRQSQELRSFSQAGRFRKSLPALSRHSWLLSAGPFRRHGDRQLFASFGPAPLKHFTPAGGFHAGKKTMRPFSSYVARLIGSFHRSMTPFGRLKAQVIISTIESRYCQFNLTYFGLERTAHQVAHRRGRGLLFIENLIHLLHDGHFNAKLASQ